MLEYMQQHSCGLAFQICKSSLAEKMVLGQHSSDFLQILPAVKTAKDSSTKR